jgi:Iron only hydrogenase large subunit, C-terminal domain
MKTYDDIFQQLVKAAYRGNLKETIEQIRQYGKADEEKLQILLHPEGLPPVVHLKQDNYSCPPKSSSCQVACLFSAIKKDAAGQVIISAEECVGCELCIESCKHGHLVDRKDFIPLFEELSVGKHPVYAMIAPAFIGQFSSDVTPGKLRAAFKKLGFQGMMEVALFADILTLKEAFEFDRTIQEDKDFLLTSCCCPMWVAMIRKTYSVLVPHMPPSVSPMVAGGRVIKRLHPGAKTVFIGPCVAKKAEAREEDIRDAVDFVLTFQEITEIFDAAKINLSDLEEDDREHSSRGGRIYARTGGVSTAVSDTLTRLYPNRSIPMHSEQANGIINCKKMLKDVLNGDIKANFLEGMGCTGGCVGGPKSLIDVDQATKYVNNYGQEAPYETPADNPSVLKLLDLLGYKNLESFLDDPESMFSRKF